MAEKSLHSICRWTFNAGKGGFVPADMRPEWGAGFSTADMIELVGSKIKPKLPEHVELGIEMHYDTEVDEKTAAAVVRALNNTGMHLAMITPGAHSHYAYGGIASLDPNERKSAEAFGRKTVNLAYGPLREAWHPTVAPAFIIWNGSFGYDLASVGIRQMYQNLKDSITELCTYENEAGGKLYIGFEPKPNEGHPAMLIPTVASAITFWNTLGRERKIDLGSGRYGVNKEFGHSEMIGLDHVYDTVEELDNGMMVHMHLNSQGYNDGVINGGPGKYDIDHGCRINGMNVAIAGLIKDAGFSRWKGHDMQTRAYDNVEQGIDRVVRSVLSWEACAQAASELDQKALMGVLATRDSAQAEDIMRHAVVKAQGYFDNMYQKAV